jgi:K+-transporting ATPase ATPase A chain
MNFSGWLQIAVYAVAIAAITKPLGAYMYRVFEQETPPLAGSVGVVEKWIYRAGGVDERREQR